MNEKVVIGRKTAVGVAIEDTRGVAKAPAYFFPFLEGNFKDTPEFKTNESAYNVITKDNDVEIMSIKGEGSLNGKMFIKGLYYWLALVFGKNPTTTGVVGDTTAKKHAFELSNENTHASATISVKNAIEAKQYTFAMLDSMKITWSNDDFPKVEMSFLSKKSIDKQQSEIIAGYIDDTEFLPRHGYVKIAPTIEGLSESSAETVVKGFSIEFKKNLNPDMYKGEVVSIYNMDFEVSGSIERTFKDTALRNKAFDGEKMAMEIGFADTKNKAGTKTPTSLKFVMPKVKFSGYEQSVGLSDISTESFNFNVLYSPETGKTIDAELINKYTY